jgi:hypothetical protein
MSKFKVARHHKMGLAFVFGGLLSGAVSTLVPAPLASYIAIAGIILILLGLWIIFPSSFSF